MMPRVIVWSVVVGTFLLIAGCGSLRLPPSDGGPAHDPPVEITLPVAERWVYDASAGFGGDPLVLTDRFVVIANRIGEIHGVDIRTGKRLGDEEMGISIEGAPTLVSRIVAVPLKAGKGGVVAYDLDAGRILWRADFEPVEAGLATFGSRIVAAGLKGGIAVFESATGELVWSSAPSDVPYLAAPLIVGQTILAIDQSGVIRFFDALTGSLRRSLVLDAPVQRAGAVEQDRIFVSTTRGKIYCLALTGSQIIWTYDTGQGFNRLTKPIITNGTLYIGGSNGTVYAIDATSGDLTWETNLDAAITVPILPVGTTVLVGTMDARLIQIDALSGDILGEQRIRGRIKSDMKPSAEGLLVAMEPRHVVLFDWRAP